MAVPHDILKQYWGYDAFRPKQEDIVRAVLDGRDTLALLATGGGKSICFQVPAMCMEGICIVISPLLALMNDQVANLVKKGIDAVAVNSAMSTKEIDRVLDNCVYGKVKFLYVSPERLQNEMFLARFKKMNVSMIAVDESHCVSQWGYDFRPDYLNIASIREFKPTIPVLALTASATPAVVQDIQEKLKFKSLNVIGTGFARANLSYNVSQQEDKEGKLLEICKKMKGCGIVYCGTRLRTREIAQLLVRHGISSASYNAGMSVKEREKAFKSWMKNEVRIMCATNAFGMGIDKPDVRFVVHADVPADPESYFQEAGRAGRDGQRAYAILLWNEADVLRLYKNVEQKYPEREYLKRVYRAIGGYLKIAPGNGKDIAYPFEINDFCKNSDLKYAEVVMALRLLELAGYVSLNDVAYLSSRMMFTISRQNLYSFQVANSGLDPLIRVLLRMYGGTFEHYVNIKEDEIAKHLGMDISQIMSKLQLLVSHGVIDYEKHTETPRLTFLTGRMHEDSLTFIPDVYENRKKRDVERTHVMEKYLSTEHCRSIQLLSYFGEKGVVACGICDVCRSKSKSGLQPVEFEQISQAVMNLALHQEFTMEELPQLLPSFSPDHLIEFTRIKIDAGELVLNDKLRITLPGFETDQES